MPIRTNDFQRLIATIQSHLDPGSTVTESAMLVDVTTGAKREVDVVVLGHVAGQRVTVSLECRDRARGPSVAWVEEMQAKHSRLGTNVLVLVSHTTFTPEAIRVANVYGIRCLVLDDVDASTADRLFPDARSLWGKAWEITIDRVDVSVGTFGTLAPEWFRAVPDHNLFLEGGAELGSARHVADAMIRCQRVIDMMSTDAKPEHCFLELVWERPIALDQPVCVQKLEPLVLRPIERFRVVAKCVVPDSWQASDGGRDGRWGGAANVDAPND